MFKQIFDLAAEIVGLTRDVRESRAQLTELENRVALLSEVVQRLAFDVERLQQNEAHEREKLALRLENVLLRFERRLPPPPPDDMPALTE